MGYARKDVEKQRISKEICPQSGRGRALQHWTLFPISENIRDYCCISIMKNGHFWFLEIFDDSFDDHNN